MREIRHYVNPQIRGIARTQIRPKDYRSPAAKSASITLEYAKHTAREASVRQNSRLL
jgi:hypothetical protein